MANLIRLVVNNYNDVLKNVKGKLINTIKKANLKKECYFIHKRCFGQRNINVLCTMYYEFLMY